MRGRVAHANWPIMSCNLLTRLDDSGETIYLKSRHWGWMALKRGVMTMATLYNRVTKGMEVALDKASKSVEAIMEKAEDTAEVIKVRLEKTRLEREIAKKFAELGSKLYEKAVREGKEVGILQEPEVQALIEDLKSMDRELAHAQALIEQEMEKQAGAK
jgi:hypothetical protein